MTRPARPVFLNPMQIQMPVGAVTSILHRVTGVLLAVGIPMSVYLLDRSLQSEQAFTEILAWYTYWPVKAVAVIMVWALAFHILAGVRHLLSDFDVGASLRTARRAAWLVNLAGVAVALFAAGAML